MLLLTSAIILIEAGWICYCMQEHVSFIHVSFISSSCVAASCVAGCNLLLGHEVLIKGIIRSPS